MKPDSSLRTTKLVYCAWLLLLIEQPIIAAEFTPAPQKFRQEISSFAEGEEIPRQPVQLIESSNDGAVRAFIGGRWHELRDGHWRINESISPRNGSQFAFASIKGERMEAPVPWREVKQVLRFGPTNFIAAA